MKTVIFGMVCAVLAFLLLLCTTAVSAKMMRQTEVAEALESAVDNAVDNCMNTVTYTIDSRDEFVADVLQNILQEYHSTSEDIDVQIDYADEDKGILFITVSATYVNVIGRTQTVSYQKQCIFAATRADDRYAINYYLDDGSIYRSYVAADGDAFPVPGSDPEMSGGIFLGWEEEGGDGTLCTGESDFPAEATGPANYVARFEITVIEATGLAIEECYDTMRVGETQRLVATVYPEDATDQSLIWTSDDTSVCTVTSSGKVTAIGKGSTYIRVQLAGNAELTAYVPMTVTEDVKVTISSCLAFDLGSDGAKAISVASSEGEDLATQCSFESTDESVATVDGSGNVTATGAGTAYIKVQYGDNDAAYMPVMAAYIAGWSGTYDGQGHCITAICPGAAITYGDGASEPTLYTAAGTYYDSVTIEFEDLMLTGTATVSICQAERILTAWTADGATAISAVTIAYPDAFTFLVRASTMDEMDEASYTGDTPVTGAGTFYVDSASNNAFIYSCTYLASAQEWEVTIQTTPTEGTGTITFGAASTESYAGTEMTVTVNVGTGGNTVLVTADESVGVTYDGEPHSISVTPGAGFEGATITYSTDGESWSGTCPAYADAGTYVIMWKAELSGYATASGAATLTIGKAPGDLEMAAAELSDGSVRITVSKNTSGGKISALVPDNDIITVTSDGLSGFYATPTGDGTGTVTITFVSAETDNYAEATAAVTITIG